MELTLEEAIAARHSVRQYTDAPISGKTAAELTELIEQLSRESCLHMQLILDDPECFHTLLAHYGRFSGASNYIALVGPGALADLEERCGYYGEKIVLEAQRMGLNTCWVGGTYGRGKCRADTAAGEKLVCVIAIGYGANQGSAHKSRPLEKLCSLKEKDMPAWFLAGVRAAMLAPTALNQQKFFISLEGEEARITAGRGVMTKIDLGIVKYNFEAASGHKCR